MSEEIDIVERLENGLTAGTPLRWTVTDIHREAASEITRLRAENDDQAHKLLIAGWRKDGDGSVWTPPENDEIERLRGELDGQDKAATEWAKTFPPPRPRNHEQAPSLS